MKNRKLLTLLLLLSLICVGFAYRQSKPVQFEYRVVVTNKSEPKELKELGDNGWELVAATFQPAGLGGVTTLYFKRQRQ